MSKASIVRVWTRPDGSKCVGGSEDNAKAPPGSLMLYNSLLDEKVPFVPASGPGSKSLSWMLSMFGIVDASWDKPGFADAAGGAGDAKGAGYLDVFAAFHDEVRSLARTKADPKETMTACDRVRDVALVELGVRLEDRPDGKAIWKLEDPAVIQAQNCFCWDGELPDAERTINIRIPSGVNPRIMIPITLVSN
eukprot:gene249-biopygen2244